MSEDGTGSSCCCGADDRVMRETISMGYCRAGKTPGSLFGYGCPYCNPTDNGTNADFFIASGYDECCDPGSSGVCSKLFNLAYLTLSPPSPPPSPITILSVFCPSSPPLPYSLMRRYLSPPSCPSSSPRPLIITRLPVRSRQKGRKQHTVQMLKLWVQRVFHHGNVDVVHTSD